MKRLEIKYYNMTLTKKQLKKNHVEKLINMNYLQVKKYYLLVKVE